MVPQRRSPLHLPLKKMLTCTPRPVNATETARGTEQSGVMRRETPGGDAVAEVKIEDGIIKVKDLDVQDPRAAAVLQEYPEARWAEVMRRALKIGLGYLKGGAQD